MSEINKLISDEQAKIELYKLKISACENRIQVLRSILSESNDAIDVAVGAAISVGAALATESPASKLAQIKASIESRLNYPKRALADVAVTALKSLMDGEEKSFDDIFVFLIANNIETTRHNLRVTLDATRKKYNFCISTRKLFWKITPEGLKYLESL